MGLGRDLDAVAGALAEDEGHGLDNGDRGQRSEVRGQRPKKDLGVSCLTPCRRAV